MSKEEIDKYEVIRAGEITVAQGYKCKVCGVIYGNEPKVHCSVAARTKLNKGE